MMISGVGSCLKMSLNPVAHLFVITDLVLSWSAVVR